ncbi:anti-sigma factor [Filimonas lacunae]|nr:anti-sigma factor [Filimonas lacunae]
MEKYYSGNCTGQERREVQVFLQKPESEALLNQWLEQREAGDRVTFEADATIHPQSEAWRQRFYEQAGIAPASEQPAPVRNMRWLKQAAIWAGVALTGLVFLLLQRRQIAAPPQLAWIEKVNHNGQRAKIILANSSVVYLGAGSSLRFPQKFEATTREIYLTGEAFFEIGADKQKPFIVHSQQWQTQVLGTSFKIEAFAGVPFTVQVATGKVRVEEVTATGSRPVAVLAQGERAVCYEGQSWKDRVPANEVTAWKEARLSFNNQSLEAITTVLERWYNKEIVFTKKAKAKEKLTLILDASAPPEKVFKLLASAAHFRYTIEDKQIIIH